MEIQTYEQYAEGGRIRIASVSSLLAEALFSWFGDRLETPVEIEQLRRELKVTDANNKLFIALLNILERNDYLSNNNGFVQKASFDEDALKQRAEKLHRQGLATYGKGQWLEDAVKPSFELARACIPQLPELLRGELTSVQLLFSAENYQRSTAIYEAHLQEVYYGLIAQQIIKKCHEIWAKEPDRQIRILEVGAGSGKGTIRMLEGLRAYGNKVHFSFTDIGNSFLRRAKKTFKDFDCDLDFRLLDISDDPATQGFEAESFDIAFATNVVHATPDLRVTLNNMQKLLRRGGNVYINEITEDMAANTVTYGTTPGWWLPADGLRLPYCPVATTTTFRSLLAELGFTEVEVVGYPGVPEPELAQAIIQGIKK
ncbi:MAG: class I SAM-dependent methyltransferase [Bacteroidota bacterium]